MKRLHLTEAQRGELARIMAVHPLATDAQVAAIFLARTGRPINRSSVEKRRRCGPYKARPGNGHLSEAERAILARLVRDADELTAWPEVARQFEALAGRPITYQRCWKVAVEELGLPRVGKGRRPRPIAADVEARLDEERRAKLARAASSKARFDRLPRVGRVGRVLGATGTNP